MAGGKIGFDRYMEMALYYPGLGYYAGGQQKFGSQGDFVTAPEVSSLYGQALARQVAELLQQLDKGCVIEFGAGSGKLAVDLVTQLEADDALPQSYTIIELSAELRHRQQQTIRESIPQHESLFHWLDHLPESHVEAVIIANEVLDAMPVHRFRHTAGRFEELLVGCREGRSVTSWGRCSVVLTDAITALSVDFDEGYESEINLRLRPWIHALSDLLGRGAVLLVDYGYARSDYYHPDRYSGTLMCHYRHIAHDDALLWPGLQDITSHVDFTAVAEAASAVDLDVHGYTSQGNFLIGCGIDELIAESGQGLNMTDSYSQAGAVKRLMLPTEMGEVFKVMALGRGIEQPLRGFGFRDLTGSL
ncbi:class I SAM-dependent methyltransferase [Solemya elarraichensis gill symbiont]|uniref:class I SAM-dependent methyltransferase n=1 Tax=Solemya elarraichensis gill symbiont TaxID=1918949 RepID=UPI001FE4AD4C|nr:SAM-dependent methyltransferase [Solemya elarraichensis gill symbiont]